MSSSHLYALAEQLGTCLLERQLHCTVAESCTGGMLAATITDVPGSSQWFDRGFITYSNRAKHEMLGVSQAVLEREGAVSRATVSAMAEGALLASGVDVSIATSGIAGPGGGSLQKPVGTVWIAWAYRTQPTRAECYCLQGDRLAIRMETVRIALDGLIQRIL